MSEVGDAVARHVVWVNALPSCYDGQGVVVMLPFDAFWVLPAMPAATG